MLPPIVLVHGSWCTGAVWHRMASLFEARGFTCHAPTLPNHALVDGGPHPDVGSTSINTYIDFLAALVHRLDDGPPPILIGHSLGGLLVQLLGQRVRCSGIVAMSPGAPAGLIPVSADLTLLMTRSMGAVATPWRTPHRPSWEAARYHILNLLPEARAREVYAGMVYESGRVLFEAGFWVADPNQTTAVTPDALRCPLLVVGAGQDRAMPPDCSLQVARYYPRGDYREYRNNSHWLIDEHGTESIVDDLAVWARRCEAIAPPSAPAVAPTRDVPPLSAQQLSDETDGIRRLLSYKILDWVVTDAEALEALQRLGALQPAGRARAIDSLGAGMMERLFANLPREGAADAALERVVEVLRPEQVSGISRRLLSTTLTDWVVSSADIGLLVATLCHAAPADRARILTEIADRHLSAIVDHLPPRPHRAAVGELLTGLWNRAGANPGLRRSLLHARFGDVTDEDDDDDDVEQQWRLLSGFEADRG